MTIEKRGKSYRIKQMYKGKYYYATVDHKPTAKEAAILIAEAMQNTSISSVRGTFEHYAIKYMEVKEKVLSAGTIRCYDSILRNIPCDFKDMQISEIETEDIQKVISDYSVDRSPKSTKNLASFISAVFAMYRPKFNYKVSIPQPIKYEAYIPTHEDIQRILEHEKGTMWEIGIRLACYGIRLGEQKCLTPEDIDGNTLRINKALTRDKNNNYVEKTTKTVESTRLLYIDDELADLIKEKGFPTFHPNSFVKHLHNVQKKLGIKSFRVHDLRHYFATELSQSKEISEADILYMGGWSSPYVMKKIYRHNRAQEELEQRKKASDIIAKTMRK